MLIEAIALLTTYAGVRWYETHRKNQRQSLDSSKSASTIGMSIPNQGKLGSPKSETSSKNLEIIKSNKDNFEISVAALGFVVSALFIPILFPVGLVLIIYNGLLPLKRTENWLRQKKVKHDTVISAIYIFSLWTGHYVAMAIGGLFYHLGRRLSNKAQNHSKKELLNVFEHIPTTAWLMVDGMEVEVPVTELKKGDIVVVSTGSMIPVDGRVSKGESMVDQRALTGESQPVEKVQDDLVFAGTFLVAGKIFIEVEKAGTETTLAKINTILTQTIHFKPQMQLKGELLANQMAAPVLIASGMTYLFLNPYSMLVVLNSTVGNLTNMIGSIGTLSHFNMASKAGILIKDGQSLETLKDIDTVLFDKTGTLTEEEPTLGRIIVATDEFEETDILRYAAVAEQKLTHPIARTLVKAAQTKGFDLPAVDNANYQLGRGIRVTIEQSTIQVGSARFMQQENIQIPACLQEMMKETFESGNSLIFVAMNGKMMGGIELKATIRPEIKGIIKGLRERGIKHIAIVSGDHREPTKNLARQLQMDTYFYEVLPEEKAGIVEKLQQQGNKVCFVGDGINDAIAMKKSDVSISLKGASSIATDAAQVILMDGTLHHLCVAFDISHKLALNLKRNLNLMLLPLGLNILCVYTIGIGLITAIVLKNIIFFVGLTNTVLPTLRLHKRT
jgi:heavy metal translocating P-type ATPase